MPSDREKLQSIETFPSLVKYLREDLDWPIESDDFDDLSFDWEAEELGLDLKTSANIQYIKQLRPLDDDQPWGIFFAKFEPKRLPVVALRRILGALALKKRASAAKSSQPAWQKNDLLFISAYGEDDTRHITFAHFADNPETGDLPVLRVLGWDGSDTALHIDHVHETLTSKLRWPTDTEATDAWRETWSSAFTLRHREVITTSKQMAIRLADLAREIRNKINSILTVEKDTGPMHKLMAAFKEALIHDMDEDGFADTYAQTIAYGLLSARISRPAGLTADNLADMVPITNPFLKELLETFLHLGGRRDMLDFDELGINDVVDTLRNANMEAVLRDFGDRNPAEDPVIHFYELFLKEYDAKKRMQRGVFFTPRPVVSFIVRSVDELLRTEFGLADGLADTTTWGEMAAKHKDITIPEGTDPDSPFVVILDPATGTATFLVEVIDVIHKTMTAKWRKAGKTDLYDIPKLWNEYVPKHLLPRLHGYELMMAPYAIAHMKIGLKLFATGYRFGSDERARIYLTNALESAQDFSGTFVFAIPALAHEAEAVNAIKRDQRFTVVMGNPPYSIFSANLSDDAKAIVEQYRYIDGVRIRERGALKAEVILQDDYVKFLGLAQNMIRTTGIGTVGMITNGNCYENPVLRGVRYALHCQFEIIYALDLGGQSKSGIDEDKNVFDIDTSVAVSLLVHHTAAERRRGIARVAGSRRSKYEKLLTTTASSLCCTSFAPKPEQFLFKAFKSAFGDEYGSGFPIDRAFNVTSIGIKTARDHLVLDIDRAALVERIETLRDKVFSVEELRERFAISDNTQWRFAEALPKFRATYRESNFAIVEARPFDQRWLYFHPTLVFNTRPTVNRHVHGKENLCLLTMRRIRTENYAHFFVVSRIGMGEILSSADNCNFFPLYLYHDELLSPNVGRELNLTRGFLTALSGRWEAKVANSIMPEDIFHYVYAVFHSPTYRSRYEEFLKIDFPRLPLTGSFELFRELARLGGELVALHLLESPKLDSHITTVVGTGNFQVEKVSHSDETVWIDKAKTCGFRGVPEEVWDFHIGGYQVCAKWLKDRQAKGGKNRRPGRVLTDEDIDHYQRIVVVLSETIRIMAEIDEVIEAHGGWPDAFITEPISVDPKENPGPFDERTSVSQAESPSPTERQAPRKSVAKPRTPRSPAPKPTSGVTRDVEPTRNADGKRPVSGEDNAPPPITEIDRQDVMAVIREVFADGVGRDREAAIRDVARAMGYRRVGSNIQDIINRDLLAAARRKIIFTEQGVSYAYCGTIGEYERFEFLKTVILAAMGQTWWEREDAIREAARHIGFRRTGKNIQTAFKSAIRSLIRRSQLESDGTRIRRAVDYDND